MCFQPCSQPLKDKAHKYTFTCIREADSTLRDPVISEGKQMHYPLFSLSRAHAQVQALAHMPSGLIFSHCIIVWGYSRNPGLRRKWQIKSLSFVEVTRPLLNIHWGQCRPPGKGTPILMQITRLSPLAPCPQPSRPLQLHAPPKCSHSHAAPNCLLAPRPPAPSAFLWNSERARLSKEKIQNLVVYAIQALIPVRFAVCSALKFGDPLYP